MLIKHMILFVSFIIGGLLAVLGSDDLFLFLRENRSFQA